MRTEIPTRSTGDIKLWHGTQPDTHGVHTRSAQQQQLIRSDHIPNLPLRHQLSFPLRVRKEGGFREREKAHVSGLLLCVCVYVRVMRKSELHISIKCKYWSEMLLFVVVGVWWARSSWSRATSGCGRFSRLALGPAIELRHVVHLSI